MPPHRPGHIAVFVLLVMLLAACAPDADERERWLRSTLEDDNYALLLRNPEGMAGKYAKMGLTPYNYFRGTIGQYLRDATQPGGAASMATAFGSAASSDVLLVGDPHPENLGSYRLADGTLTVDFNDFDASRFGPYHLDVRRLALGFDVASQMMVDAGLLTPAEQRAVVRAVVDGYVSQIDTLADGGEPMRIARIAGPGRVLDDLMRRADRDGRAREELTEFTVLDADRRTIAQFDTAQETSVTMLDDALLPLDAEEALLLRTLISRWPQSLADNPWPASAFEPLAMGRRVGPGVSSYPLLRYYVVLQGPTNSPDDDWLIEVKEAADAPAIAGLADAALVDQLQRRFANNAERTVWAQRQLQVTPHNDPLLGWAAVGPHSFRVRDRTKFQKGADVSRMSKKLEDGDWVADDIAFFAHAAGQVLARAHATNVTASDRDALTAIHSALRGDPRGFVEETMTFVDDYGPVVRSDHARFLALLEVHGPLLGFRP